MRSLSPWLALVLAGCASFPRMTRPPLPPPDDAEWLEGEGGVKLYTSTLLPDGEPTAVVSLVVGPEVAAGQPYPLLVAALRDAGFAVALLHPRGTGHSPGMRGDLDDFQLFLSDQRTGLAQLRARFAGRPIFLLGHSAGAAFALELAAHAPGAVAGLVLVNPAYRLAATDGMGPSLGDMLAFAANLVFRPAALTVDMNSRPSAVVHPADRAEAEAMQADPLVVRYFSMRFLLAQRQVMERCPANAALVNAPLLLVQGDQDALVDPAGNDEILAAAKHRDATRRVAPGAGHGSSAVETQVAAIVGWLDAHR